MAQSSIWELKFKHDNNTYFEFDVSFEGLQEFNFEKSYIILNLRS